MCIRDRGVDHLHNGPVDAYLFAAVVNIVVLSHSWKSILLFERISNVLKIYLAVYTIIKIIVCLLYTSQW